MRLGQGTRESGSALLIGLVFLVLMTMVGLFVARSSMLQLRMSDNAGGKATSFEEAEQARIKAEDALLSVADTVSQSGKYDCAVFGAGFYASATANSINCSNLVIDNINWDANDSVAVQGGKGRYVVEYQGEDKVNRVADEVETGSTTQGKIKVHVFRIYSRGIDADGAETVVKTIYLVRAS